MVVSMALLFSQVFFFPPVPFDRCTLDGHGCSTSMQKFFSKNFPPMPSTSTSDGIHADMSEI